VIALALCAALTSASCNKLLNCKSCEDDTHCESCPDGYKLDSNKVCRYDCAAKFGVNCTSCTEKKCFCPVGEEWNSSLGACVAICGEGASEYCTYCGKGPVAIDLTTGKCSTCDKVFGEGCLTCDSVKCLTAKEGYEIRGAVAVECPSCPAECTVLFPGCQSCDDNITVCVNCSEGTVLVGGFCKYKMPSNCSAGEKPIYKDGKFQCGSCTTFDPKCIPNQCSGSGCTRCRTGFGVSSKGTCVNCSETFEGCGLCTGEQCTKCSSSSWILTPNGCFNQNPYVEPTESNGGLIAGIVIACIVLIALIVLAVYCIIATTSKKGNVDPAVYEDDFEFKSMSVL